MKANNFGSMKPLDKLECQIVQSRQGSFNILGNYNVLNEANDPFKDTGRMLFDRTVK